MPLPTLAELVTPVTSTEALTQMLTIANTLGLPTTAWQRLGISRTIYASMAQQFADYSDTINFIAQGGYASYASVMVDANGDEVTTWMDLIASEVYGLSRIPAEFAELDSAQFVLSNTSSNSYGPFAIGELHFGNSTTGARFTSTEAVTIPPLGSIGVGIIADVSGSGSTSAPTDIDTLITPYAGVGCSNNVTATGTDAESNGALFLRCIAKLGSLSPNGAALAYYFVATSILDPTQPFYNEDLTQPITRVKTIVVPGLVNVYIANASGAPSAGDVTIVDDAIQEWCVPLAVTAVTSAAANLTIAITYTAYVPAAASVTSGQVTTAVNTALGELFPALPIGGIVETTANEVPLETIRGTIFAAIANLIPNYAAQISVAVSLPAGDTVVTTIQVPVLGTVTPTVTFT